MANPLLLFWSGLVLLLGLTAALLLVYLFPQSWVRPWVRRTGIQFTLLFLFGLGAIAMFWASKLPEKIDFRLLFDWATLDLALLAVAIAIRHEKEMRKVADEMHSVADQMATKFMGYFPKNLQAITQVISKAKNTVDVMSDYVGYGHYSAPDDFDAYFRKLQDMPVKNVQVRMLVYGKGMAQQMHESQFATSDLKEADTWERLKQFCKRYDHNFNSPLWKTIEGCNKKMNDRNEKVKHQPKESRELDRELKSLRTDFDHLMFDRQLMYMKELLLSGVQIRTTEYQLPICMWCEDSDEAVFTFLHEGEQEVSFLTRDSRFVKDYFEKKFDYLWDQGTEIKLIDYAGHLEPDWQHETETPAGKPAEMRTKLEDLGNKLTTLEGTINADKAALVGQLDTLKENAHQDTQKQILDHTTTCPGRKAA